MNNENKRQWVHLGAVLFGLLFPWLMKWQAAGLGIVAVGINLWILPKIAPELFREIEKKGRLFTGIVAYPITVTLIILICPWQKKELAAAAWAILAFGDSFSNILGRNIQSPRLPWNPKKSIAGLISFWIFGLLGSLFFLWWVNPLLGLNTILKLSVITVFVTGLIETLDIKVDDNISVGLSAIIVLLLIINYL